MFMGCSRMVSVSMVPEQVSVGSLSWARARSGTTRLLMKRLDCLAMATPLALLRGLPKDSLRIGAYWAAGFFVASGILTVLVPNMLFVRMTPISWFDYVIWPVSALLIGGFMALRHAVAKGAAACSTTAGTGGVAAFLGFSCPICNKVLVLLIGTGGVLTFVEPYRHVIGVVGLLILAGASWWMLRVYAAASPATEPTVVHGATPDGPEA
jgi:hypothetical protein